MYKISVNNNFFLIQREDMTVLLALLVRGEVG